MVNKEEVKKFKEVIQNGTWRDRYSVVKLECFKDNQLMENKECVNSLIKTAHFDPSHIVRQEAVKTCNLLNILYQNKPVRLRKMRSINNTLIAEKIDIQTIILKCVSKAGLLRLQRTEFNNQEWVQFYEVLESDYPKVFDLLEGNFTTPDTYSNRKKKNKVQAVMKPNKVNQALNKYIYGNYMRISNDKIKKYAKQRHIDLNVENV